MAVPLSSPTNQNAFKQYAKFVFARDNAGKHVGIENYEKNLIERAGDCLGWGLFKLPEHLFVDFPKKFFNFSVQPQVLGLVSAAVAMRSIHYLFLPRGAAKEDLKYAAKKINHSTQALAAFSQVRGPRLAAYLFCQASALGFISRTVGRFTNDDLMKQFKDKIS
jgi:hypothetical protein